MLIFYLIERRNFISTDRMKLFEINCIWGGDEPFIINGFFCMFYFTVLNGMVLLQVYEWQ